MANTLTLPPAMTYNNPNCAVDFSDPSLSATIMDVPDDEQLLALPFHIPLPRTSENTTNCYLVMTVILDKISGNRLQLRIAYKQLLSPSNDQQPTHLERAYTPPHPGLTVFMPNCLLSSPIFILVHAIWDYILDDQILLAITVQQRCHDIPVTLDVTGDIALIKNMHVFTSSPHALGDVHVDYSYACDRLQNLLGGDDIQWPATSTQP